MRTDEEILQKIDIVRKSEDDWLGVMQSDLIQCLPYALAKPFLNAGVSESDWHPEGRDRESVLARMKDYMEFAWDKANNCRGISASRSLQHYSIWVWLLGDEDKFGDLNEYEFYGKDKLVQICDEYGWDSSQWDDGVRVNSEEDLV